MDYVIRMHLLIYNILNHELFNKWFLKFLIKYNLTYFYLESKIKVFKESILELHFNLLITKSY